ncbi:unnamed protein product [Microthlaspi erraticum]|uniref:SGNH hydrolase-type esterase domain-containing protein n=1 Tax=Microthlaspi erraticum TaxID=1685480 RepID=A0A6D2JL98_9BRAS|nr:unnamed protein product [Microthlaspi erraticum]
MCLSKAIVLGLFIATLTSLCNAAANVTAKPLFPAILMFGDSTADTGNNNYHFQAVFKAKHLPYGVDLPGREANGRFCNGKLISDVIATNLNIKEFVPPFLQPNISDQDIVTGVCFASAGAGYDDRTSLSSKAIPVSQQPSMFKNYIARLKGIVGEKKAMEIINNALVVISAGPNDFILNFYDLPTRRLEYPDINSYQDFVLKRVESFVRELYSLGCRNIVVGGLAPMGCLPVQMTAKFRNIFRFCVEQENKDSVVYNQKLIKKLPEIEASLPGSKFLYANVYDPLMDMIKNPRKYGFKDTKRGCCGTGFLETSFLCNVLSKTCSNHADHLFWDSIHPSEAAYKHLGSFVDAQIRDWVKA